MDRIVDIATEGRHLSLYRGFLIVEEDRQEVGRVALDDIHAVIVHAHGTTWSANLVAALAERGAPMVFCGANHSPIAVTLPIEGHHAQNARFRAQWGASKPLAKQLWRRIVSAKIAMQGSLLAARAVAGAEAFPSIAARVKSGDTDNLEAQAARRYWPLLMGRDFRRDRDSPGANALLNYGYAVMRATVARAVVATGLHPTIGINHANRGNALALADDLVEPFRPLVDAVAVAMTAQGIDTLDPARKRRFARLIAFDLRVGDEASPVSIAAARLAQSLARAFETGRPSLQHRTSVLIHPLQREATDFPSRRSIDCWAHLGRTLLHRIGELLPIGRWQSRGIGDCAPLHRRPDLRVSIARTVERGDDGALIYAGLPQQRRGFGPRGARVHDSGTVLSSCLTQSLSEGPPFGRGQLGTCYP